MKQNDNADIKILGKYSIEDIEVKELIKGKAYGFFLRETDEQIFPQTWTDAYEFGSDGYAYVKNGELWGLINMMGQIAVPCEWNSIEEGNEAFHDGLCGVKDNNDLWGFVNTNGELILPCRWTNISGFFDHICAVCDDFGIWTFIDTTGKIVYSSDWKEVLYWSEGLLPVQNKEGLWGFVNSHNEECIPCKWDAVASFSEGLCAVQANGRWGAIDKNGELTLPLEWDEVFKFDCGEAYVMKNGQTMVINKQGQVIDDVNQKVPFSYSLEPETLQINPEEDESILSPDNTTTTDDAAPEPSYSYTETLEEENKQEKETKQEKEDIQEKTEKLKKQDKQSHIRWEILIPVGLFSTLIYLFSDITGYVDYNSSYAYNIFDPQQFLYWIVAFLGGVHIYDIFLPLTIVAAYLYKHYANKDDFENFKQQSRSKQTTVKVNQDSISANQKKQRFGKQTIATIYQLFFIGGIVLAERILNIYYTFAIILFISLVITSFLSLKTCKETKEKKTSEGTWGIISVYTISFLLLFIPLRVTYFSLFTVNYLSAGEKKLTEMPITGAENRHIGHNGQAYYLFVNIDNKTPYKLSISETDYQNYKEGKISNVLANVRQGCFGFTFIEPLDNAQIPH